MVSNFINEDRLVESFISLAKINSGSDEIQAETRIPSTDRQWDIANYLKDRLYELELSDIELSENAILTAFFKGNSECNKTVGLFAHFDTSFEVNNENVCPILHDKYSGGNIELQEGTIIDENDLKPYVNQKIITSDGRTLLGADDKAGVAEIFEVIKVLKEHPEIKRPNIKIAFTPDEETGSGVQKFDIENFGADFAYTIDGDLPNVVENESFNAFNPEIEITGKNVHPGYAKSGGMINALMVAAELIEKLPKKELAHTTEGHQGYYHVMSVQGDVSNCKINMLVRDHDYKKAQKRIVFLEKLVAKLQKKYNSEIKFDKKERYHNMKEGLDKAPEVLEFAKQGISRSGMKPKTKAIRGGTDGSFLSLKGLPTPNLGAGGLNFHSKCEFLPVSNLIKCTEVILNILQVIAEKV